MNVEVVIGANYGDEGKGMFTDYLCSNMPNSLVVMTNGGSQRGHTVELEDGTRHIFQHFCAGTFRNAVTYFPREYLINPMQFVKEYEELSKLGYKPISFINPYCIVQLPGDIALNWYIEKSRGEKRHGSVGCGIWETKYRMYADDAMPFNTFLDSTYDQQAHYIKKQALKYRNIRCAEEKISVNADIFDLFMSDGFIDHFIADCYKMRSVCSFKSLEEVVKDVFGSSEPTIIFENGQGLKLDQYYGMADESNTTPSFTGSIGVANIMNRECYRRQNGMFSSLNINLNYISRTYLTKHGAGKFEEFDKEKDNYSGKPYLWFEDSTNIHNEWQGSIQFANLEYFELLDRCYKDKNMFEEKLNSKYISRNINMNIVMTHANEVSPNNYFLEDTNDFGRFISSTKFSSGISKIV